MSNEIELVTIEELQETLKRFGVDYSERMLRYALRALGIARVANRYLGEAKRGRPVALFDGFAAWVVASAYFGAAEPSLVKESHAYDAFRAIAVQALDADADEDRVRTLAYWLMITSLEFGMKIERLRELLTGDPSLLELATAPVPDRALILLDTFKTYWLEYEVGEKDKPLIPNSWDADDAPVPVEMMRVIFAWKMLRHLYSAGLADFPDVRR